MPSKSCWLPCPKARTSPPVMFDIFWTTTTPHHTTTILRPSFRDHPGEPAPEENFWTLWCKGRLPEADTPTIRQGATPSGPTRPHLHHPPIFYRSDALPDAQRTVLKHFLKYSKNLAWFRCASQTQLNCGLNQDGQQLSALIKKKTNQ